MPNELQFVLVNPRYYFLQKNIAFVLILLILHSPFSNAREPALTCAPSLSDGHTSLLSALSKLENDFKLSSAANSVAADFKNTRIILESIGQFETTGTIDEASLWRVHPLLRSLTARYLRFAEKFKGAFQTAEELENLINLSREIQNQIKSMVERSPNLKGRSDFKKAFYQGFLTTIDNANRDVYFYYKVEPKNQ